MKVFVIRWQQRIGGEEDSGVFYNCFKSAEDARTAIEFAFNTLCKAWKTRWEGDEESKHIVLHDKDPDFRSITIEYGSFDYIDWYIERLTVV